MLVDVETVGEAELTGGVADLSEGSEEGSVGVEEGYAVVAGVGEVEEVAGDDDGLGSGELAWSLSEGSELSEVGSVGGEDLDSVVVAVFGDVEVSVGVEGDVGGEDELSWGGSELSPASDFVTVGGVDDDAVVVRVGDVDESVGSDGDADGFSGEVFGHGPAGEVFSVGVEALDAGLAVDDEEFAGVGVEGDGPGVDDLCGSESGFEPDGVGWRGV